jgi:hypothetical protein
MHVEGYSSRVISAWGCIIDVIMGDDEAVACKLCRLAGMYS